MSEFTEKIRNQSKTLALKTIYFSRKLPNNAEGWTIQKQLIRSGTSVAANYRAATRGRSDQEFYHKLCIVVEELDETIFWLEICREMKYVHINEVNPLIDEMSELFSILNASKKTLKTKLNKL